MGSGEYGQFQKGVIGERIAGFEDSVPHVDFVGWVDDDSGEPDEIEIGAKVAHYDVCKEMSAADFEAAK